MHTFTVLFPFCGLGGGALGFVEASAHLFGEDARFVSLGGIDNDRESCEDFEALTKSPALCRDIATLTPAELRAFAGDKAPDVVFTSAPCVGSSGLLSEKKAKTPKYEQLNNLSLVWVDLMTATWDVPPKLMLFENVPRITTRAKSMLTKLRAALRAAGYVLHEGNHECGELGGLAQIRRRYLLVARQPQRCPPLLYKPPKLRVRACGEVLGELPMPEDESAGPLHKLPKISWLNWVRLSQIPAGGDWRDLPNVLAEGQKRRESWKRHEVSDWEKPVDTISGYGSNGVQNVADPRMDEASVAVALAEARRLWEREGKKTPGLVQWFKGKYGVGSWYAPSRAVIGGMGNGAGAVADPRAREWFKDTYGVRAWEEPFSTLTSQATPSHGRFSVADPRVTRKYDERGKEIFRGTLGILGWEEPAGVVTASAAPSRGVFAVADPRVDRFGGTMGVLGWMTPAVTVTGEAYPSTGAFSIADPRCEPFGNVLRVTPWEAPTGTITHSPSPSSGAAAVADPRVLGFSSENEGRHWQKYRVEPWDEPAHTVTSATRPGSGAANVADPRKERFGNVLRVVPWDLATGTVTSATHPMNGGVSVADPRVPARPPYDHAYAVLSWGQASFTIATRTAPGCGAYSVADPRVAEASGFVLSEKDVALKCKLRAGSYGVIPWEECAKTVTGSARIDNGAFAVVDPRIPDAPPVLVVHDIKKPPSAVPIIIAADGTWHRPLTTLELAVLQDLPAFPGGKPLTLAGTSCSRWRKRIGNAVPRRSARAIAEQMLVTLLQGVLGRFMLSGSGDVWVKQRPTIEETHA